MAQEQKQRQQQPGKMHIRHYNIHDIYRLSVSEGGNGSSLRYFDKEYGIFKVKAHTLQSNVDLYVTIGDFDGPPASARSFGKFRLDGDWLYGSARYKVASWRFALRDFSGSTTRLLFSGGLFGPYFLQHFLIEQIMRYQILQKGYVLVHGGCVVDHDRSLLFPGLGHAGKTALALQQVLAGRSFQADDYTILAGSGQTYSYPRRLHISDHTNEACPDATRHLSLRHRASIKLKRLIYYLTLRYGDLDESLQIGELIPDADVRNVARLGAVVLLTASNVRRPEGPRLIEPDLLIRRLVAIDLLEGRPFNDILLACHYHGQSVAPAELWKSERDILRRALIGVPGYEVLVPGHSPRPAAAVASTGRMIDHVMERMAHALPA